MMESELKICQAMNREVSQQECAKVQKELPKKFCKECDWFDSVSEKKQKDKYVPSKYIVYISKALKKILIEEARKNNVQPSQFIAKILIKNLLPESDKNPTQLPDNID